MRKSFMFTRLVLRNLRRMSTETAATSVPKAAAAPAGQQGKGKKDKNAQFHLKTPKGTKDWLGSDMVLREAIFAHLILTFKRHGGVTIDTPVFELREILTGKYGEDSKLIYNLEDQGGELTSLRYDLTVPFARFVACNNIQAIKRYHIAKVYRRDQPAMTKGRMREFYQCDFDIAGQYDAMVPDAEVLSLLVEGMSGLGINDFTIKLNHRKILDGIFQACGVKEEDVRKVSSAVDKLDKLPWEAVKKEMVVEKNQPEEVADKIGELVMNKGTIRDICTFLESSPVKDNELIQQGVADMKILADYIEAFGIEAYLSFDLSLARGLDYYTGLIYEVVTKDSAAPENAAELKEKAQKDKKKKKKDDDDASEYVGVGSIAAGGRYDGLVGMFSNGKSIPCVGISFGIERIFSIIKARAGKEIEKVAPSNTQVFVMALGGGDGWTGFLKERMAVAHQLRQAGLEVEYMFKNKANAPKQFTAADKLGALIAVILGKEEYPEGKVRVKVLNQGELSEGEEVAVDNLVDYVKGKLGELNQDGLNDVTRLIKGL